MFLLSLAVQLLITAPALFASPFAKEDSTIRNAVTIGLYGHYGFVIPHTREIKNIADSYPWGISADLSIHFTDSASWQYLHAYPRLGATLAYYNFDKPDVLGSAYALIVYAEPFLAAHKDFGLSFRMGLGIAYLDNVYHPETNPDNLFYSTKISFPLVANLMTNYRLDDYFLLRAGATYKHISNGGIRQPNKGINFPSLSIGVDYAL